MTVAPCQPWTSEPEIRACDTGLCQDLTPEQFDDAIGWASELMYLLDRQRLSGLCEATLVGCWGRPVECTRCGQTQTGWETYGPIGPVAAPGPAMIRYLWDGGAGGRGCSCAQACAMHLLPWPNYPARQITAVNFGGIPQDVAGYQVVDRRWVRRLAGAWPTETDISLTVLHGRPIPVGGRRSATDVAVHWLRAHCGGTGCQLPDNLTSVSREELSVTVESLSNYSVMEKGLTGLPWPDRWLIARRTAMPRTLVLTTTAPPRWQNRR